MSYVIEWTDANGDTCTVTQPQSNPAVALGMVVYAYGHLNPSHVYDIHSAN